MLTHFVVLQDKYAHLKDLVLYIKHTFEVGDNLPSERELADIVGYTRSTIRESLIRLECFGFISIEHGKSMTYLRAI
jgi:DNA-binding FadR family transcriptional regulator